MVKSNLIANFVGQGWTALMGIAFIPLYIKYLGIEAYGLIGLFIVLQACFTLFDIGMSPALGREMARYKGGGRSSESIRDLLRSIEIIALAVSILIAFCVILLSDWIAASWLKGDTLPVQIVANAFVIMGIVACIRFVEAVYRSALVGLQRQVLFNAINIVTATLKGLGSVAVLIWISPSIEVFFIWNGVVSLASLLLLAATTYSSLPSSTRPSYFSISELRSVCRFAGGMVLITFLALMLTQIDKILLSKLLTLSEYGVYTLAAVVSGGLYLLISPITQAFYPRFCSLHASNNEHELSKTFHLGAQLVSVIAGSAAIVIIIFSETLLRLWTQDPNLAASVAPLLSLLTLGNLLNGLMWIPYQTQLAYGWTSLALRANIIAVVIIVPSILWVTPRYGAIGAATVWVALNIGYLLIPAQLMYRRILKTEKLDWYFKDIFLPLGSGLLGAYAVYLIYRPEPGVFGDLALLALSLGITLLMALFPASHMRHRLFLWLNLCKIKLMKN